MNYRITNLFLILLYVALTGCQPHADNKTNWYNAKNFGVKTKNSASSNQKAIQKAVDHVSNNGGGTLFFKAGEYKTGTIYLKDGVHIYLDQGAVISGSDNITLYPQNNIKKKYKAYTLRYSKRALIWAEGQKNIGIKGEGTIDGNGNNKNFKDNKNDIKGSLPLGIRMISCENVTIKNINLRNGGLWMQHYLNCNNLKIQGIRVFNHHTHTNDGLDIDGCQNVRISDCFIDSHDDAIALKSSGKYLCENITITNCVLRSHCHCLKFGTETTGGFKKVNINNCTVSPSKVKVKRKGEQKIPNVLTGVCLLITDGGTMEDIHISDIVADSVYAPLFVRLGNRARKHYEGAKKPEPGIMKDIMISDIHATDAHYYGSTIAGFPGHYIENVTLSDINIQIDRKQDKIARHFYVEQPVPENEKSYPDIQMFGGYMPSYGFFIRHVKNIKFNNIHISYEGKIKRPAFILDDIKNITFNGFDIEAPVNSPVFEVKNSENVNFNNYTGFNKEKCKIKTYQSGNVQQKF